MNRFQHEMDRLQDERKSLDRQNKEMKRLYRSAEYANRHPVQIEVPGERQHNPITVVPVPIPYNHSNKNNYPQQNRPALQHVDSIYIHDTVSVKEDTTGNYAFVSWLLSNTSKPTPSVHKRIPQPVKDTGAVKTYSTLNLSAIPPIKIFFAINSATVDKRYDSELDFVAGSLKQHKNYRIKLSGYTDNSGPAAFNIALSKRRADAVRQYLLQKGIQPDRINTAFYGEESPHASNQTTEGKVLNRRVAISFIQD